jgi:ribosomal protein S8
MKKIKILRKLKEKGFLTDKKTISDYEHMIKEQDKRIKKIKNKLNTAIISHYNSVDGFINFLENL